MPSKRLAPVPKSPSSCTCGKRRFGVRSALTIGLGVYVSLAGVTARAGDILRGGTRVGAKPGSPPKTPISPAQDAAAENARETLARTAESIRAVQQMQAAARNLALRGTANVNVGNQRLPQVPNGLKIGGLEVAPGVPKQLTKPAPGDTPGLWKGAALPKETVSGSETSVTIKQNKPEAVLNWRTFNVGRETTVDFDQSSGTQDGGANNWIVFNKISDPSGRPSQILGNIEAEGAVYLINANGILFGGSSQVNLHSLVASSLPINDNLIGRLLNNPTSEFLFSAPTATDPGFTLAPGTTSYTLADSLVAGTTPTLTASSASGAVRLSGKKDFTLERNDAGTTTVNFTAAGVEKIADGTVTASYFNKAGGDIVVKAGAQISAPTTASNVGGRVSLIGPNVRNAGTISTPDGQTILAAGLQVGFAAHSGNDPTLRGLDTFIGREGTATGTATNSGLLYAPRANVTIAGKTVEQLGAIASSTSVSLNGRVDLRAEYDAVSSRGLAGVAPFFPQSTGLVTFGAESVTAILPETESTEAVVGTKLALQSQVNVRGRAIHLAENSTLFAPGAAVTFEAGTDTLTDYSGGTPINRFVFTTGQIYLDRGVTINVAGTTGVLVSTAQNILSVELRGSELADSPLQRDGVFRGTTIDIDLRANGMLNGRQWIGTPLADVSGYVGLIQRTIGELTVDGGSVTLNAGEAVVLQSGAKIDVSGGFLEYGGGLVKTTRVLAGAHLFDISQATPDLVFDGVYTGKFTSNNARYGIAKTWTNPLLLDGAHFEEAYTSGANGGTVSITAPAMALDGELLGQTFAGERQRSAPPAPSTLALSFKAQNATPAFVTDVLPFFSPTPPQITFGEGFAAAAAESFAMNAAGDALALRADRKAQVSLSSELLTKDGFGVLRIENTDGDIAVPAGVALQTQAGGSITLSAANIDVQGSVSAPGGNLAFSVTNVSPATADLLLADHTNPLAAALKADPTRGLFTLGASAVLNTAGLMIDDRTNTDAPGTGPLRTNGGAITIDSFSAELAAGSVIDASGGVAMSATGARTYGTGGAITIRTGKDLAIASIRGGHLDLGAKLLSYSGTAGGALTLQASSIQVGGSTANPDAFLLQPEFFNQGGFTSFTLTGIGDAIKRTDRYSPGLIIAPGTVIEPIAQNWLAVPLPQDSENLQMRIFQQPEGLRTPVSLAFSAAHIENAFTGLLEVRGDAVMGEGASITTDPRASVSFSGDTVALLGSVAAPAGRITITGASSLPSLNIPTNARTTVVLGANSRLSTAGTSVFTPDRYGRQIGSVLAGGTIAVSGNIAALEGAVLDVSGTSNHLDIHPANLGLSTSLDGALVSGASGLTSPLFASLGVSTRVDSNGGAITLSGAQELFTNATLIGAAGGSTALGGSLSISSGRFYLTGEARTTADLNLIVSQAHGDAPVLPEDESAVGRRVRDGNGKALAQMGHFAADDFAAGGFDALALGGNVKFTGAVAINANRSISVGRGGIIAADSAVALTAPQVTLGQDFLAPMQPSQIQALRPFEQTDSSGVRSVFHPIPTFGAGALTISGDLIDVGNLSLQGIGKANLVADGGEIRGDGTLDVAGDIYLRAAQVYPPTAVSFTIAAHEQNIVVAASSVSSPDVTLASAKLPPGFRVGSPLLGTTVASIDGATVTLAANANATISSKTPLVFAPNSGSVTITGSGTRQLPLSAGGELNVYGAKILQGGTLRAPIGTIHIGWDGLGAAPVGTLTGESVAATRTLTLAAGSVTSVSANDPLTGEAMLIPYGFNPNGTALIDPTGQDITAGGVPEKAITFGANSLQMRSGARVDLQGGGDLFAYRFVRGTGGTTDLLGAPARIWDPTTEYAAGTLVSYAGATWSARTQSKGEMPATSAFWSQLPQSFAVLPSYQSDYAPFAPFNNGTDATTNLAFGEAGYAASGLAVGDRIHLGTSAGLDDGFYTLLPARYALLPGAFLVTPNAGANVGTFQMAEGASLVAGYRFNDLNDGRTVPTIASRIEVVPAAVLAQRAEYQVFSANEFLREGAEAQSLAAPRLPMDAGRVVFSGVNALTLAGKVAAQATDGGRAGLVDISTSADLVIAGPGARRAAGKVVLDATNLSSWGAESLLIGGVREHGANGTTHLTVRTGNLTLANAGAALFAPEVILVSNESLTLASGSAVLSVGANLSPTPTLLLGNPTKPGSGDGLLLRVHADPGAQIARSSVSDSTVPTMTIGAGAFIAGGSITLDSTAATTLDPSANLEAQAINLASGKISLEFDQPGALLADPGLVLSGPALSDLAATRSLSLLGYSSIDLYGTGEFHASGRLELHAAAIRGVNTNGGEVAISARSLTLDNTPGRTAPAAVGALDGTVAFNAETITLGAGALEIEQFARVELNAANGIALRGTGKFHTPGALAIDSPAITGAAAAQQAITADGALSLQSPGGSVHANLPSGLGASLTLTGASIANNTSIYLPSGSLTLHATSGDVVIGAGAATRLDVGGTARNFFDLTRYTSGGEIHLVADAGSVNVAADSTLAVDAARRGGDAGMIAVSAPTGGLTLDGRILGEGGRKGVDGSFSLDVASVPGNALGDLNATLNAGGFNESRTFRIRTGDILVDRTATAHHFNVSTDAGSIDVVGTIDASGATGGAINLRAAESVTLESTALLTAAAEHFSNAGKGGAIALEAGSQVNGLVSATALLDLKTGSTIDLTVASNTADSARLGRFTGTLHLRAPQNAAGTDLQVSAIDSAVLGASSIVVEGYKLYALAGGNITPAVQAQVRANGETFVGTNGTPSAGYQAMHDRLLANNAGLDPALVITPGAELINLTGDLTLGSQNSAPSSDWNLANFRFGPKSAPGVLTMRAAGDLVFLNALNDGFTTSTFTSALAAYNPLLPGNAQSWSYRLTAGADFAAADFTRVEALDALNAGAGSLLLGKNAGLLQGNNPGPNATTASLINPSPSLSYFQTIRTGSGDITISAARDIKLLNQFATIYTAGTRVADPTTLYTPGDFVLPIVTKTPNPTQGSLGAVQQNYPVQYSLAGGNVSISAGFDITHQTRDNSGNLIADSSRQLPNNWLYRRGYVDPATGEFGAVGIGSNGPSAVNNPNASTTWWIDFSNFFEGVGALGGGNVTLEAGHDIANVDAVIPTNARMPKGRPDAAKLVELGGGDLSLSAGHDLDGGVYYVERGHGELTAGNSIHTNATRTPSLGILAGSTPEILPPLTWLPTTLFAGQSSFDVSANGDVLLGPVANTFLLPEGLQNKFWNRTYFSTYSTTAAVNVTSLGGDVTLRTETTLPDESSPQPLLEAWLQHQLLLTPNSASAYQPFLRLNESHVLPFSGVAALLPATLRATALSGNINLAGDLTLSPSATGTLELAAAGAINGLQANGVTTQLIDGQRTTAWSSSRINLSDANPASIPGVASPLGFSFIGLQSQSVADGSNDLILEPIDIQFRESGSSSGDLQAQQALHAPGLLHAGDANPVRLYATTGNIAGLTLFSGKSTRILAGHDITDIAFYIQNVSADDLSIVSAGRDIVAYNPSAPLRIAARTAGNSPAQGEVPNAGDLQISGPGTLEVLTGRDFDLGVGASNPDGTALGLVSIGNARNPYLPFDGAGVVVGAGAGLASGLAGSTLDFAGFLRDLTPEVVATYLAEIGAAGGRSFTPEAFANLPAQQRDLLGLEMFYRVLRDTGRKAAATGSYAAGFEAIDTLFGGTPASGDILLTSREIKTLNGGGISLFAPGGTLTVGFDVAGSQPLDQGILTERGGAISIFTDDDVIVGTSRIFTLRGGDITIWSSKGDIAAGASSKTVQSAPPTRVLIDPQTADVKTDLSGLATGGGIGVLATVKNVPPGNVDLIAPAGTVDAGDAGVRASGNITVAAATVLNATNFSSGGTSSGVPASAPSASAPNLGGITAAGNTAGAANNAANDATRNQERSQTQPAEEQPSIFTVEVIGYGGSEGAAPASEEEEQRRKKKAEEAAAAAPAGQASANRPNPSGA